jgi:hypothetical protein
MLFMKMSKTLHTSFAVMMHLVEGLCFNALLMPKVQNSIIFLVGTRIPNSVQDGMTAYFVLENINKK